MAISIALEGPEGVGKTTLHGLLPPLLEKAFGVPVKTLVEPGGTPIGMMIREMMFGKEQWHEAHPHGLTNLFMFSAQRSELVYKEILPWMAENPTGILLGDRSWMSTLAIQSVDGAGSDDYLASVQKPFIGAYPTKIFYTDLLPEESMMRVRASEGMMMKRNYRDRAPLGVYQQIRQNYLKLVGQFRDRVVVFDGFDKPWEIMIQMYDSIVGVMAGDEAYREILGAGADSRRKLLGEAEIKARFHRINVPLFGRELTLQRVVEIIDGHRREEGLDLEAMRIQMFAEWASLGVIDTRMGREGETSAGLLASGRV